MKKTFTIKEVFIAGWKGLRENIALWVSVIATFFAINFAIYYFALDVSPATGIATVAPIADLLSGVIGTFLMVGILIMSVRTIHEKKNTYTDLFTLCNSFRKFFSMIALQILSIIIVFAPLILFFFYALRKGGVPLSEMDSYGIVPEYTEAADAVLSDLWYVGIAVFVYAIVMATALFLSPYYVALSGMGPIKSIKESIKKTNGYKSKIFLFFTLVIVIFVGGVSVLSKFLTTIGATIPSIILPTMLIFSIFFVSWVLISCASIYDHITKDEEEEGLEEVDTDKEKTSQDVLDPVVTTDVG